MNAHLGLTSQPVPQSQLLSLTQRYYKDTLGSQEMDLLASSVLPQNVHRFFLYNYLILLYPLKLNPIITPYQLYCTIAQVPTNYCSTKLFQTYLSGHGSCNYLDICKYLSSRLQVDFLHHAPFTMILFSSDVIYRLFKSSEGTTHGQQHGRQQLSV